MHAPPFSDKKGKVLFKNVEGITYAANESGCLVGVLAAKMAQKLGGNTIGAVGGLKIPPVDIWIAGYKYCANKAVPGTKTIVQYSNDFGSSGQVPDRRAERDRTGREGALPGRGRLRARHAQGC